MGEHVLGGAQPLVDGAREAALEQHRTVDLAELAEQVEVLHVARADLKDVGRVGEALHLLDRHHLGHDRQPGLAPGGDEQVEPRPAEPLEGVGRGARLEHPAAEHVGAVVADEAGGVADLLAALDRAGTRHHHEPRAADEQPARLHHRVLRPRRPVDQPVLA